MQPPPAHIWILDTPTEDLPLMFPWHNVFLNVSADIAGWTSSTLVSMVCTAGTSKRRPMHVLREQDTRVLEIFRLVLLTHVHLARLSGQKRAARAKWAPPVWAFSEYIIWRVWRQGSQFFFFPLACHLYFSFCVIALWKQIHWNLHVYLAEPSGAVSAWFSQCEWVFREITFRTRLWSSKDTINEPPFFHVKTMSNGCRLHFFCWVIGDRGIRGFRH